VGKPACRR